MESRRFVIGRISKFWHILWFHLRDSVQLVLCHGESFQHFERSDVFRQHLDLVPGQIKISQVPNNLKLAWLDFFQMVEDLNCLLVLLNFAQKIP